MTLSHDDSFFYFFFFSVLPLTPTPHLELELLRTLAGSGGVALTLPALRALATALVPEVAAALLLLLRKVTCHNSGSSDSAEEPREISDSQCSHRESLWSLSVIMMRMKAACARARRRVRGFKKCATAP